MGTPSRYGLENQGLCNLIMQSWTLPTHALVGRCISRREGMLAHKGAVVVCTGNHTGRTPNDKYFVQNGESGNQIWLGKVNRPICTEQFERLHLCMAAYYQGRDVFIQDTTLATLPECRLPVWVITDWADTPAYDQAPSSLVSLFTETFKTFSCLVSEEITLARPVKL